MSDKKIFAGAEFLISDVAPEEVFTPEDFTQEHHMIYKTAKDFVNKEVLPHINQIEEKDEGLILGLLAKAGELGLNATDVPEAYGGLGLDKVSSTVVAEAMGSAGSFAVVHAAHTGIGTLPIVYFGNEDQKRKYLPKLASGEWCGAYCLTESDAGSDALNARTKAVLSEDGTPVTTFEGTFTYISGKGAYENIYGNGTYKGKFITKNIYVVMWQAEYAIKK